MIYNYHRQEMKHVESQYQIIVDRCKSPVHINYVEKIVMKKNVMEWYLAIHTYRDN